MKKTYAYIISICLILSAVFSGCVYIDPSTLPIISEKEMLEYMNTHYEGTFTLADEKKTDFSDGTNSWSRHIYVYMNCTLPDGTVFPVTSIQEYQKSEFGWSNYLNEVTDYYYQRFGSKADLKMVEEINTYFKEFTANPGYKLFTSSWEHKTNLKEKYQNFDEYYKSYRKKNFFYADLVLFCAENSSKELTLSLNQFLYDASNNAEGDFIKCITDVYYLPDYKNKQEQVTKELLKTLEAADTNLL